MKAQIQLSIILNPYQKEDILNNFYWKDAVILDWKKTKAIVTEDYINKSITIKLKGQFKKEFLNIIRKTFETIHKRFNKLIYSEYLNCLCEECIQPEFDYQLIKLETIQKFYNKNIPQIRCDSSTEEVEVLKLLNQVNSLKEQDGMKGAMFEAIVKELLYKIYPNSDIKQSVKVGEFEFDFIVTSSDTQEYIVIEAKGYKSSKQIQLGEFDKRKNKFEKHSLKWFLNYTFPIAKNGLKSNNILSENYKTKACYITSCIFSNPAIHHLSEMNHTSLKPQKTDIDIDRKKLLEYLKKYGMETKISEIKRYYK